MVREAPQRRANSSNAVRLAHQPGRKSNVGSPRPKSSYAICIPLELALGMGHPFTRPGSTVPQGLSTISRQVPSFLRLTMS